MPNQCKKGSVVGGALMVAGSCIGAGMLGLPILTGLVGFFPSILLFIIAWFFMTATGLLIVEVNQWFDEPPNFITMVSKLLGRTGKFTCWILYLFLFYSLLVAYIAGSGIHTSSILNMININSPYWFGSVIFVIIFGFVVYLGTKQVDFLNRVLMIGKILTYLCLIIIGLYFVDTTFLNHVDLKYSFVALPILITSFGFQNTIPTISRYLDGNIKRIKQAIIIGSLFTLIIYIFWQVIALGILPISGKYGILQSYTDGMDAAQSIKNYVNSIWIGTFATILAFFAMLTSFLIQTLTLVHFLGDGMNIQRQKRENAYLCLIALAPPLIFAIIDPTIFYSALSFAGGICAVTIFGIIPVLMVWRGRYYKNIRSNYCVKGGKPLLVILFSIALFIAFYQIKQTLNFF